MKAHFFSLRAKLLFVAKILGGLEHFIEAKSASRIDFAESIESMDIF